MFYKKGFLLAVIYAALSLQCIKLNAQTGYWSPITEFSAENLILPTPGSRLYQTDVEGLRSKLLAGGTSVELPSALGTMVRFEVKEITVLHPICIKEHPEIKTYTGISDSKSQLRLTVSPYGIMALITSVDNQEYYLQPANRHQPEITVGYLGSEIQGWRSVQCGNTLISDPKDQHDKPLNLARTNFGDGSKRTYTISVVATGEYTTWAGSQGAALAAITASVMNINLIYERDLGITFLIKSPNSILFTNSATDPFTEGGGYLSVNSLDENRSTLSADTNVTGNGGYSLGHVFNAGWGSGLAELSGVCQSSGRDRAASGLNTNFPTGPSGPVFDRMVAHEIGHQFGASHTFSANTVGCGNNNIAGSSAWEPGAGSSIMSYGNACGVNTYQERIDPYFHGGSLAQMSAYMMGTGNTCASITTSGNAAPVLLPAPIAYTIPHSTPFRLSVPSTDADGDKITTNWEQVDALGGMGSAVPPLSTNTIGPLFRSFQPSEAAVQYFPSFSGLLSGNLTFEVLPTVARSMTFRGTVRDNHAGAGRTANRDVTVTTANCGAFKITSNTGPSAYTANGVNTTTLTWNTASCVTCPNINIKFSTDGGYSYPYTILANTPNDGTQTFVIPNLPTCQGRFMIEASNNIFYNISEGQVSIVSSCEAFGSSISPATPFFAQTAGSNNLNMSMQPIMGSPIAGPIAGTLTPNDLEGYLAMSSTTGGCVSFSGNYTKFDTVKFVSNRSGIHTITKTTGGYPIVLSLYSEEFNANDNCRNFITSSALWNGTSVSLPSFLTATLCKDKTYFLVIGSFNHTAPALPSAYTITINGPVGTTIYSGQPAPTATGYNYCYVITNASTGNIVEIRNDANLSNSTVYRAGNYTIYGLSTTATLSTLTSNYQGQPFITLYNAMLNMGGGVCGNFSTNSRQIVINSSPLPLTLVSFKAQWKEQGIAEASWTVGEEKNVLHYELERSYNGRDFSQVTVLAAENRVGAFGTYSALDAAISVGEAVIFYRLKMVNGDGSYSYSGVVKLQQNFTTTQQLRIVPNPIQGGMVKAELWAGTSEKVSMDVMDMAGRIIQHTELELLAGKNDLTLNFISLNPGMYLLRVKGNTINAVEKFVK